MALSSGYTPDIESRTTQILCVRFYNIFLICYTINHNCITRLKIVNLDKTSLSKLFSLKIHRGCSVFLSVGMSVLIGSGRPSTRNVIGVPRPAFLDEPPNTSSGKKILATSSYVKITMFFGSFSKLDCA